MNEPGVSTATVGPAPEGDSATFHARDLFAPVAAALARGEAVGQRIEPQTVFNPDGERPLAEDRLFRELKRVPEVAMVSVKRAAVEKFYATIAETMMTFISFFAVFAGMLAFGVAYNSTRVALSERGRELATLRVLGLSRWEISYILLGEVSLLVAIGLPLGCLVGLGLVALLVDLFETELYRMPFVVNASTFGYAVALVVASTALSAFLVRRRLDRLDLIAVLKTRE